MPDVGLSGGDKLEAYLRKIAEHVGPPQEVQVGFLAGTQELDGTSIPMIAWILEFGAPKAGIPPRPFFRGAIAKHKGEWGDQLGKALITQDYDGARALGQMGHVIAGEIRDSITELTSPALSPVTLMLRKMRKGDKDKPITFAMVQEARARVKAGESTAGESTKPLIYSGTLLNSIGSEVTGG